MSIDAASWRRVRRQVPRERSLAPPGPVRRRLVRLVAVGVLLLVPLAAGTGPASANPGFTFEASPTPVTTVGGTGGGPFPRTDCPPGSIATGVRASVADNAALWATVFSLECRAVDASGTALVDTPAYTQPARGTPLAVKAGSERVLQCPEGEVLTGLQAYSTTTAPVPWGIGTMPPILTEAIPRCRTLDLSDLTPLIEGPTTQVTERLTAETPPAEVQNAPVDCPAGQFIVGFGGRSGWAVDRFEPYCGTLRVGALSASVQAESFDMPIEALQLVAQRNGGGAAFAVTAEPMRVWPGSYSVGVTAPTLDPAWLHVEACTTAVPHGDAATCAVQVEGRPDAGIAVSGPNALGERQTDSVVVTVANAGPAATAATVSVTAGSGLSWGALPAGCSASGATVTCPADLASATAPGATGAPVSLTLPVQAGEGVLGPVTVTAEVDGPGDGIDANDVAALDIEVVEGPPVPEPPAPQPTYRPAPLAAGRAVVAVDGAPVAVPVPTPAGTVASALTADGTQGWSVTGAGTVSPVGDAPHHGSIVGLTLRGPVVSIAPRSAGDGYVLIARDGGAFAFGQSPFRGSAANLTLQRPISAGAMTCSGNGYYMAGEDGGVFTFGDAQFHGSLAHLRLQGPVVGIVPRCGDDGYWLVATDGGVFTFGNAGFHGSRGGVPSPHPVVGLIPAEDGAGYWLVDTAGNTYPFGSARRQG